MRRANGDTVPVLYSGALVSISGQNYALSVMQDISERKRAERQLRESVAMIRNLEPALNEHAIVTIATSDGMSVSVNDTFCSVSGYILAPVIVTSQNMPKPHHTSQEIQQEDKSAKRRL